MSKYIMRLDDAATKMDTENWSRMEELLDEYNVKPLVGVIPDCQDSMMDIYEEDSRFWEKIDKWMEKDWCIALHGYTHVYCTGVGGINPVNSRSEFAGLSLEEQKRKIKEGVNIFRSHGIEPKVFFAPSHTFDKNTIVALKEESNIKIISDTIANKPYSKYGFTFVPQQCGRVRRLPFNTVTFCYHPNMMDEKAFEELRSFLQSNSEAFVRFPLEKVQRSKGALDYILEKLYFLRRK